MGSVSRSSAPSSTTQRASGPRRASDCSSPPGTGARSGSTSESASRRSVVRHATSSWWASTSSSRWSARREGSADHRRAGGRDREVAVRVSLRVVRHVGRPAPHRAVRQPGPANAPAGGRRRRRRARGLLQLRPRGTRGTAGARHAPRPDRTWPCPAVHRGRARLRAPGVAAADVPPLGRGLERACAARLPARRLSRGTARRGEPLRGDGTLGVIRVAAEVREALVAGGAVVGLETTLVAHGFPPGEGVEVGLESERRVRAAGAVPATVGVLGSEVRVGLTEEELGRFGPFARKVGPSDLAAATVQGAVGATTVGGTLAVARAVGIRVLATGGIGGVHRGFPDPPDVSADLGMLARTPALVVSAGVKSLLDVPATAELLESLGIPVLGFRVDTLPLFYAAAGGPPVSARTESAEEAARVAHAPWRLGAAGLLLGRPPDEPLEDVEPLVEGALAAAAAAGVSGQAVTPYVLAHLHRESEGRTEAANKALVAQNAQLAGEVALEVATAEQDQS